MVSIIAGVFNLNLCFVQFTVTSFFVQNTLEIVVQ